MPLRNMKIAKEGSKKSLSGLPISKILKIQSEAIFSNADIVAGFSRKPANMSFNYGLKDQDIIANRRDFLDTLGINYRDLVCAKQVHGNSIKVITVIDKGRGALDYESVLDDADAFITDLRCIPLAIFTADCLSIFLFDPSKKAIGIVHAGWKGTRGKITERTVKLMQQEFKSDPQDLIVGLGPSIRDCCYEVGSEFADYFSKELVNKNGRYFLDITGANRDQLLGLGVNKNNITDSGICTCCKNGEFFSFRKEKESAGRMMSVIMLK